MVYVRMRFAEKLDYLISLKETNQSRLSRQTGIAQSAISEMTKGKRRAYMDQALRLARALGVPLDYLADDGLDDVPGVPATEQERRVWEVVRAIGPEEAWRRLVGAPPDQGGGFLPGASAAK